MAFTKEQKAEMMVEYKKWIGQSQATFVLEYSKMNMKLIDAARVKVRDAGGEIHVVKNTLFQRVLAEAGMPEPKGMTERTTIVVFAFSDPPALAKLMGDLTKNSEIFKLKAGYIGKQAITPAQVKALADLPPLPVVRAQLLGTLQAPAGKLVRTIAEPARSIARVFKALSEKEAAPAAA